jgi:hypothetical protein
MTMEIGTLRQYEQRERARCIAEYGTIGTEYDRLYPRGSRTHQWIEDLQSLVSSGGTLTRYEADSMDREGIPVYRFVHGYDHALPAGWQSAEIRKFNA